MTDDVSNWENEGGSSTAPYGDFKSSQTIHVTIRDGCGQAFTYIAVAADFHSAVQSAAAWFRDHKGNPQPTRDTIYELNVPGDFRNWRVCGGTVQIVE